MRRINQSACKRDGGANVIKKVRHINEPVVHCWTSKHTHHILIMADIHYDITVGLNNSLFILFFGKFLYLYITYGGCDLTFN